MIGPQRSGDAPRPVALLFAGQGSQRVRMAAGLYRACPTFTDAMDEVFDCFGALGEPLRSDWLSAHPAVGIDEIARAQPLLFAVNYALGRMILGWGVRPVALVGHSVGEVAAAALAGVFRLPDAVRMLRDRVACAATAPSGGMLAVAASVSELADHIGDGVAVGAVNAPRQTILAGLDGPLLAVEARLRAAGILCRRLRCSVAFHSPAAAHIAEDALPTLLGTPLCAPALPVYSAYTTTRLNADVATDPRFWARHAVDPVLFWPTLDALLGARDLLLIDTSPDRSLTAAARRHPAVARGRSDVIGLLPTRVGAGVDDVRGAVLAAERIRGEGHDIAVPILGTTTTSGRSAAPIAAARSGRSAATGRVQADVGPRPRR